MHGEKYMKINETIIPGDVINNFCIYDNELDKEILIAGMKDD